VAARWSALALALQLALAAGLAVVLAATSTLSGGAIGALTLLEICAVALLASAAPLVLAGAPATGVLRRGRHLVRALLDDAIALELELVRMAIEPWRASPDTSAATPCRPVLLIHGLGCSRAVWRPLLARLRATRVGPARALSLEPLLADIDTHVAAVLAELELLFARAGGRAVTIVAHSMGGLLARAASRAGREGLIARIITIGAPHHGTALACRFHWDNARQMCPGSAWLAALDDQGDGRRGVSLTSLYSLDDNYIVPAQSARLRGARLVELRGLGHLGLLNSRRVLDEVMAELRR